MPVRVSYPGVYIEEVPSGVRTIVGVATSIAAFLGRASSGPVDEPVEVNGIGEYERKFGGVSPDYPMSLAVRDFFQNGGSRAVVVRLYQGAEGVGVATLTVGGLTLAARYPGKWAEALRAEVKVVGDRFNLVVRDSRPGGTIEQHLNLTVADEVRRVDRILAAESRLVRWKSDWPAQTPTVQSSTDPVTDPVTPLEDKLAKAQESLRRAIREGKTGEDLKPFQKAVTDAEKELNDEVTEMGAADSPDLQGSDYKGIQDNKTGLFALEKADLFNLLCIPPDTRDGTTDVSVFIAARDYCVERRAMLIVDPPQDWADIDTIPDDVKSLSGLAARNAAIFFPRILQSDPGAGGELVPSVACGVIAGIIARTDAQRGVWKAPAGVDANLSGVDGLVLNLTDDQNGRLNELGINSLRSFPVTGRVVWGARTMRGANLLGDEYKYIPVRRLALFLEESLYRGIKWVVFEPNDEPLWAQIRLNVGAFMQNLFRQGAFQGRSPREAYFVKCDKDTTTQNDINLGIVNVLVGFSPLKPAEFVIIKIQQLAGQIEA